MEYELAGPCYEDVDHFSRDQRKTLRDDLKQAVDDKSWLRAVELQDELVRHRCWDIYEWLDLAKYLNRTGRHHDSLRILTQLYDEDPNWFERLLRQEREPFLTELIDSPEYDKSELRTVRKKDRREAKQRRQQFRQALRELPEEHRPADPYVARNVCPFECCVYRTWSVHGRVPLYEAPRSDTEIEVLEEGDTVVGRTGNVHLSPRPAGVVHAVKLEDGTELSTGEILFVLDYLGEGYSKVFYEGEVHQAFTYGLRNYCPRLSTDCWGEYLDSEGVNQVWWVKVDAPSGITGWTDRVGLFGGMDSCG